MGEPESVITFPLVAFLIMAILPPLLLCCGCEEWARGLYDNEKPKPARSNDPDRRPPRQPREKVEKRLV